MPKPADLEKFFSDPKFADDKDFLVGAVNKILEDRIAQENEKKAETDKNTNVFDRLFGAK